MKKYITLLIFILISLTVNAQSVFRQNDSLMLNENNITTSISPIKSTDTFYLFNNKIYYLYDNTITFYDIINKQYVDIIKIGMKSNGSVIKSSIINMILNINNGLLYFTTIDNYNNENIMLTWVYNINLGVYKVFSDGMLDNVDYKDNVTVIFDGYDYKGHFTQRAYYSVDHNLIAIDDKVY